MIFSGSVDGGKGYVEKFLEACAGLGPAGMWRAAECISGGIRKPDQTFGRGPVGDLEGGARKPGPGGGPESSAELTFGGPGGRSSPGTHARSRSCLTSSG